MLPNRLDLGRRILGDAGLQLEAATAVGVRKAGEVDEVPQHQPIERDV